MRALFLGDIVGRAGRQAVYEHLPGLIKTHRFDFVVVNGENAAGGFGINEKIVCELMDAGVDVVTTGNHVWDQKETTNFIDDYACLLRPINYPPGTPGRMHRTETLDFIVCVAGGIDMEMDDGLAIHLGAGDVMVQQGTNHSWINNGTETCRLAIALLDAKRKG